MNRKKLIALICVSIAVLVVIISVLFMLLGGIKLDKTISVNGYEISIPKSWTVDSKGNLYNSKGEHTAKFVLVDTEVDKNTATQFCGDEIMSDINSEEISDGLIRYTFTTGNGKTHMYYIENIKNPEPYGALIVIYTDFVSADTGKKIAQSFKQPDLGANPPEKNITLPRWGDENNTVVAVAKFLNGSYSVKNSNLFTDFIKKQGDKKDAGVNVVCYAEREDGEMEFSSWQYIESHKGKGYLYTYYDKGEGIYSYHNQPIYFDEIVKNISEEENTTSYDLKAEDKEDVVLVSFPLNRSRDYAEELVALRTDNATDKHIDKIFKLIMSEEDYNSAKYEIAGDKLVVAFGGRVPADRAGAYSYSAVVFGLVRNINTITVSYSDKSEYTFTRDGIDKDTEVQVDSAADSEEKFVGYTEEIEENQTTSNDGQVVYSGVVVISYNTLVTHPDTGEKVEVGPYAESRGYSQYLGKPISCVIKRSGSGYIATASCNGSVIASYPLTSEAELQNAINLINAYS